jgi:hypothetical protein
MRSCARSPATDREHSRSRASASSARRAPATCGGRSSLAAGTRRPRRGQPRVLRDDQRDGEIRCRRTARATWARSTWRRSCATLTAHATRPRCDRRAHCFAVRMLDNVWTVTHFRCPRKAARTRAHRARDHRARRRPAPDGPALRRPRGAGARRRGHGGDLPHRVPRVDRARAREGAVPVPRSRPFEGPFVRLPQELRNGIARHGLRNHLAAIAPATISVLAGGISSSRSSRSRKRRVRQEDGAFAVAVACPALLAWRSGTGRKPPDAFVTRPASGPGAAPDAAALQPHVDNDLGQPTSPPTSRRDFAAIYTARSSWG